MEKSDSFDRLVSGISSQERQDILSQMQASSSNATSELHPIDEIVVDNGEPFEIKIKKESLLFRIKVWLKAIFSDTKQEVIFNEYKIAEIQRYINREFPGIINSKRGLILTPFYSRLSELKDAADFLRPYIRSSDGNESQFYVFLSTLVLPQTTAEINTDVNPYSHPITPNPRPELRTSMLRRLENIFDSIAESDKKSMYEAAKAEEWLRQFLKIPFARIMTAFTSSSGEEFSCPFNTIEEEMDYLAGILCSAIGIPDEFFEALYLFAMRNSKRKNAEENGRDAGDFLNKAHICLSKLQTFMESIPIRSLNCLVHNNCQWQTKSFNGGEDWFVKYKSGWKKIFESKWSEWEAECRKESLRRTLESSFNLDSFPKFPERPWAKYLEDTKFKYDTSLGFLNWFLTNKFSECEMDLKNLMLQGAFTNKDNHTQLSEAFSSIIQLSISMQNLTRLLSDGGETGMLLRKLSEDKTLQSQGKIESTMRSLTSDVSSLIHKFIDSIKMIDNVLGGVLGYSNNKDFASISNLNTIKTDDNKSFAMKIESAKTLVLNSLNFISELELLDNQNK